MTRAHQQDLDELNLATASGRVPPAWSPDRDRQYPFRTYLKDLALWERSRDIVASRRGPSAALRLGGIAKALARDLDPDVLADGMQVGVNANNFPIVR